MPWDKVKNYDSLIDEIRKGIHRVSKDDLVCIAPKIGRSEFYPS
jgi:hypothetical protein